MGQRPNETGGLYKKRKDGCRHKEGHDMRGAERGTMQPSHRPPRFTSTARTWEGDQKDPSPESSQRNWACRPLEFSPASRTERGYISVGINCSTVWYTVTTNPGIRSVREGVRKKQPGIGREAQEGRRSSRPRAGSQDSAPRPPQG